jgi:lipoyl(octanoyl) transferase|tara:strand:+ start:13123 stop:13548 length:426 start_codon:yes stop_codon:yes gene_type:complete
MKPDGIKQDKIQAIIYKKEGEDYKFLLLRRIPSRGGFWQSITGRCEDGETHLEAAKREIKEEIDVDNLKEILEDVYSFYLEEDPSKKEIAFGFEVESDTEVNLDICPEHDEAIWCTFDEALKLLKWPQNKEALRKLMGRLK